MIDLEKAELDILVEHIHNIAKNKPVEYKEIEGCGDEINQIQSALVYVSKCLLETKDFLYNICEGELDTEIPSNKNFFTGELKELHAVLRHLTWQTEQVARGDYGQKVGFLGEFSNSFNVMIRQLEDRELKLIENAKALSQSMELMISIMDVHKDWIIVTNQMTNEVIYNNKSDVKNYEYFNGNYDTIIEKEHVQEHLKNTICSNSMTHMTCSCSNSKKVYSIASYPVHWGDDKALAHYISDITSEQLEKDILSKIAYKDELTGVYNRRYCMQQLHRYLDEKLEFSVVMVDLNGLKSVNDQFGHPAGDEYICKVIEILKSKIRERDEICRIGGDEFIVLLRNCSERIASIKLNAVLVELTKCVSLFPMSISYGIEYVSEEKEVQADELLELVDDKMYAFKKAYKKSLKEAKI